MTFHELKCTATCNCLGVASPLVPVTAQYSAMLPSAPAHNIHVIRFRGSSALLGV